MDARSSYDAQIPADMVSAVMSDRIGHARSQSFLALFICILTLVILYFTIKSEHESNKVYFVLGLCLILVFDVSQINKKFIKSFI